MRDMDFLFDDLKNVLKIDSSLASIDEIKDLCDVRIKTHTKLIAQNFNMPFYVGGIGHMSDFCHIQESYELNEYKKILLRCI
jgi:hypothetical protein